MSLFPSVLPFVRFLTCAMVLRVSFFSIWSRFVTRAICSFYGAQSTCVCLVLFIVFFVVVVVVCMF
eukprot:m.299637 g.299637  ORF g.299637 m.299637 type:complete len:66 (-) comp15872_c2_seq1:3193-3390(-)